MPQIPIGARIRDVRLTAATNGFVVHYDVFGKKDDSTFSDSVFLGHKEKVFSIDQGEDALQTLIKLSIMSGEMEAPQQDDTNVSL